MLNAFFEECSRLRVLIVGETIIDEFIEVSYEGQSMKSFCPVFKLEGNANRQIGGASAIANHLKGFVQKVDVITNTGEEIVKTRYVDKNGLKKHVEINKFNTRNFSQVKVGSHDYDVVIVADFGHGFCDELDITDGFHLMCQTNSNNFGFNRLSKWKGYRKKSVCLDLREASLQMNKRIKQADDPFVKELYGYEMNTEHLFVTLGARGSVFYDGKAVEYCKAFPSTIVDTIGAGDAFFGFACLASHMALPLANMMVPAALAGSLSTTWLCNEESVTPEKLKEHAAQFIS